jgi:hypothetical protein
MATTSLVVLLMLTGATIAGVTGFAIAKVHSMGKTPPAEPYSHDMGGMFRVEMTPAEYSEWAQLQAYKARQIAQANREVIHVRR